MPVFAVSSWHSWRHCWSFPDWGHGGCLTGRFPPPCASARGRSIAVLPFLDLTAAQADDTPLAEGLAEEITNWLAQIPGLRVAARTSAFKFRGANQDVRDVGRQLNVKYILEGSVRRGQDLVRVTVQMVAVSDGFHLWSKTFDLADADALHIEDAVSRAVAESLNTRLTKETERRWKARQSQVPKAYDLYLQGRGELRRRDAANTTCVRWSCSARPSSWIVNFPLAYVSLADVHACTAVSSEGRPVEEVAPQVIALLDRADALSPDLPESIAVRGWLAMLPVPAGRGHGVYAAARWP